MKNKTSLLLIIGMLIFSFFEVFAQDFYISGSIKDKDENESLIGVNIVEIDENGRYLSGTTTDINGNFILKVSSPNASIQISMLSYEKKVIEAGGKSRIDVILQSKSTLLEEITVIGEKI